MEPCPFCFAVKNHVVCLDYDQGWAVFCFGCAASGPQAETPEEAQLAWENRDPIDEIEVFSN